MIGRHGLGDARQQHGLAGLRRRDDESTLTFADRGNEVDHAGCQILATPVAKLQSQTLLREQWCEILEQDLVLGVLRRLEVDVVDLEQREVTLAILGWANLAGDGVAGAEIEATDLAGRYVDVVRPGEIGAVTRAQEAETIRENLQHAVSGDVLAFLGVPFEDAEDDVLFT